MNPAFSTSQWLAMAPDLSLLMGAFMVLAADIPLRSQSNKRVIEAITTVALGLAAFFVIYSWRLQTTVVGTVFVADHLAALSKIGLIAIGGTVLVLVRRQGQQSGLLVGEFYALLLFSLAGMTFFASSNHLILTFTALETFSLAMYVLAGFRKQESYGREAALKYFILGAFAAAFFLLGMVLIFGAVGSVEYSKIGEVMRSLPQDSPRAMLLMMGLLLVCVTFAFKIGLAPFHLWVPDVYEGATTPVTAFLSAGAKIAGFAGLARLALNLPFERLSLPIVLGSLAVLTIVLGNVGALRQLTIKRLFAYSSIAHSGYALVGLVGGGSGGPAAVMRYVLIYGLMNFLCFALLTSIENGQRNATIEDIQGIGFERPFFGMAMAIAMFSMAGLPPTAGFLAKFGVFKVALETGHTKIAIAAILGSVISAAVYLRVLVALYMRPKLKEAATPNWEWSLGLSVALSSLLLIYWGVLPGSLYALTAGL